ncbi:hypothetical protein AAU61_15300 [Desulfocarbo indianensis]|nr:hypothetical protein AAU61_15300 [Desulfocarbo indianensis]
MKYFALMILAAALLWPAFTPAAAGEAKLEDQRPVVVATSPRVGDANVDPNLKEIRITFSKPMQPDGYSLVKMDKDSFPQITGEAGFLEDGRTFVAPVSLTGNKTYQIWVNSDRFQNFRDLKGRPAVPYLVSFRTR